MTPAHIAQVVVIILALAIMSGMAVIGLLYLITAPDEVPQKLDDTPHPLDKHLL